MSRFQKITTFLKQTTEFAEEGDTDALVYTFWTPSKTPSIYEDKNGEPYVMVIGDWYYFNRDTNTWESPEPKVIHAPVETLKQMKIGMTLKGFY